MAVRGHGCARGGGTVVSDLYEACEDRGSALKMLFERLHVGSLADDGEAGLKEGREGRVG